MGICAFSHHAHAPDARRGVAEGRSMLGTGSLASVARADSKVQLRGRRKGLSVPQGSPPRGLVASSSRRELSPHPVHPGARPELPSLATGVADGRSRRSILAPLPRGPSSSSAPTVIPTTSLLIILNLS